MARSEPMADASLPAMRALRSPGTAIAAIIPMMATTIRSSISVNPLLDCSLISPPEPSTLLKERGGIVPPRIRSLLDGHRRVRRRHTGRADCGNRRRVLEDGLRFAGAEEARARGIHRHRRRRRQVI